MKEVAKIKVEVANENHVKYIDTILDTIEASAKVRGTGIARRTHKYIEEKMLEGKAIIAIDQHANGTEEFAGFCYIESWGEKKFVANSGLIVVEKYRGHGLAKRIKQKAFALSRLMFPNAKLFGLTSGAAVMKINTELGYSTVSFEKLTTDKDFWKGCEGCVNYDVLQRHSNKDCICRAMLYDPIGIKIHIAGNEHLNYIDTILETIDTSKPPEDRQIGVVKRTREYIERKILEGKAIIAIEKCPNDEEKFVGFCYIDSWEDNKFASISGLVVAEEFRGKGNGWSKKIKLKAFLLAHQRYPNAKLFSLTSNIEAIKTNAELGYKPVTLDVLPTDEKFWEDCKSCPNVDVLNRTLRKYCICKGMLYNPAVEEK